MALQILLLLLYLPTAAASQPYNCPEITTNDLGYTTTHSTGSFAAMSLQPPGEGAALPAVLTYDHRVTCSVAGTVPDTFQYLSVVVFFNCADQPPQSGALDCADSVLGGEGNFTMQIELRCSPALKWIRGDDAVTGIPDTVTIPADGDLTTDWDTQCGLCYSNTRRNTAIIATAGYNTASHCVGEFITSNNDALVLDYRRLTDLHLNLPLECSPHCLNVGLGLCNRFDLSENSFSCCSFYHDAGSGLQCVMECPVNFTPNGTSHCGKIYSS